MPLIVAGMHRSGTSFVASLLQRSGVDIGARLMQAGRGNERGHFENLDFVEFHERWLRSNGYGEAGWVTPQLPVVPDEGWSEAYSLLASSCRDTAWGWKDPRTTLFLDFWADVAPNARYVLLYREPSEVVDSLFRRQDSAIVANPDLAARAWLCHNGILLRFARANRARCLLANVSVIAREPHRFLAAVANRFELALNTNISSPFEPDLMAMVEPYSVKSALLRYLMPEAERLFIELEAEADLAAGVHREGPISSKRAREIFFNGWLASREPFPVPSLDNDSYQSLKEKARKQVALTTEIVAAVSKVGQELEQYNAALFDVGKVEGVSVEEHLEQ